MDITMRVHRASPSTAPVMAMVEGVSMEVTVPQLEVELVDVTGQHGTMLLRFRTPDDRAAAEEKFVEDTDVTITI